MTYDGVQTVLRRYDRRVLWSILRQGLPSERLKLQSPVLERELVYDVTNFSNLESGVFVKLVYDVNGFPQNFVLAGLKSGVTVLTRVIVGFLKIRNSILGRVFVIRVKIRQNTNYGKARKRIQCRQGAQKIHRKLHCGQNVLLDAQKPARII